MNNLQNLENLFTQSGWVVTDEVSEVGGIVVRAAEAAQGEGGKK